MGSFNSALIAPFPLLSPLKPPVPLPAMVVMVPLVTLRMRLLPESAMYKFPVESIATPTGDISWALVAGPLSPRKPAVPLPATVVMVPLETLRMRWVRVVGGEVQVAGGIHGDALRIAHARTGGRAVDRH